MLAPLSWLKEYVDITLDVDVLAERLTEVGLNCEKITQEQGDFILDIEITPNRPDCLSLIGIAREIAAIEHTSLRFPSLKTDVLHFEPKTVLPLVIKTDYLINPRFTGVILKHVKVKESPAWLKERLIKIGQRPINNIVDVTNYVMFELGNPLHAFDYDKISGHEMTVHETKGGEKFKSVDGLDYHLPKHAVVISDKERIIDLCGIKGGYVSGTFEDTTSIFIRVPVEIPVKIRKTSQALGLRSEASAIFERGVNMGGTVEALIRCVDLILELAGGEIASGLYDLKEKPFGPWQAELRMSRLAAVLGIEIPEEQVLEILERLNLQPRISQTDIHTILVTVPTYRNDLKIEEDLIEEVARMYGYNQFPKTLPVGEIPMKEVPYFKNYRLDQSVKEFLRACGFWEIYTYSLLSEKDLETYAFEGSSVLRIDNPVSREYEYLRPSLKPGLMKAVSQNKANYTTINLYELGKVYLGKTIETKEEVSYLSGVTNSKTFFEVKGILLELLRELGIDEDPTRFIHMEDDCVFFELHFSEMLQKMQMKKVFTAPSKYPPVMEDLSLVVKKEIQTGELVNFIMKQSPLISEVTLLDEFEGARTFHIVYLNREKNLSREEVREIREKIIGVLVDTFDARIK